MPPRGEDAGRESRELALRARGLDERMLRRRGVTEHTDKQTHTAAEPTHICTYMRTRRRGGGGGSAVSVRARGRGVRARGHGLVRAARVWWHGVRARARGRTMSSWSHVARRIGSVSRQRRRKCTNPGVRSSGRDSLGDPPVVMSSSARMGGSCRKGGSPSAISSVVMPMLHTST